MRMLIAISGPVAVGKSAVIESLLARTNGRKISTRELIQLLRPQVGNDRGQLQAAGDELDSSTDGRWVAEAIETLEPTLEDAVVIVDSVRIRRQVDWLKVIFKDRVWHLHLTASPSALAARFSQRTRAGDPQTYEEVLLNVPESRVDALAELADCVIDTEDLDRERVATRARECLEQRLVELDGGLQPPGEG